MRILKEDIVLVLDREANIDINADTCPCEGCDMMRHQGNWVYTPGCTCDQCNEELRALGLPEGWIRGG